MGRVIIVWLSWLIGGVCGVVILLIIICYCRLMPRHQKSFDEQYLKEHYTIKEGHGYTSQENYRLKSAEVQVQRATRPASYAGDADRRGGGGGGGAGRTHCYVNRVPDAREHALQYASSGNGVRVVRRAQDAFLARLPAPEAAPPLHRGRPAPALRQGEPEQEVQEPNAQRARGHYRPQQVPQSVPGRRRRHRLRPTHGAVIASNLIIITT